MTKRKQSRSLHSPHQARFIARLVTTAMALAIAWGSGPGAPLEEYQVKAAFIFNFTRFVEWPAGTFSAPNEPLAVCILGQDPFVRTLEATVAGKMVDARPLVVRGIPSPKQANGCHVVFIGSNESKHVTAVLSGVAGPGVLTIGDSDIPGGTGAAITFLLEGGKVRFDINVDAAERAKLRISSRLLSLAHSVESHRK